MTNTQGNNISPNILPMGAARGSNPANPEQAQNGTLGIGAHRLYIVHERLRHPDSNITGKTLPEILNADRHDIESEWIDDNMVIIVNYKSAAHYQEALERNPGLAGCIYQGYENVEMSPPDNTRTLKVRQCPPDTEIADLLAVNGLEAWRGHIFAPKVTGKKTTALIKAPNKEEADRLLEQGYIVDNGRVLAVVPSNSTHEEENLRTVLLVGVNRVSEAMRKKGGKLSELALLMALTKAAYPAQALNFIEMDGGRIGHVAFVLLRSAGQEQSLLPFKDATSDTTLKWASLSDFPKICSRCLEWPEHNQKCPRHQDNQHRYTTDDEITKRAQDIDAIILGRFAKQKRK